MDRCPKWSQCQQRHTETLDSLSSSFHLTHRCRNRMFSGASLLRSGGRQASSWIAGSALAATGVVAFSSSSLSFSPSDDNSSYRSNSTSTTSLEAASKSRYGGSSSALRRRVSSQKSRCCILADVLFLPMYSPKSSLMQVFLLLHLLFWFGLCCFLDR